MVHYPILSPITSPTTNGHSKVVLRLGFKVVKPHLPKATGLLMKVSTHQNSDDDWGCTLWYLRWIPHLKYSRIKKGVFKWIIVVSYGFLWIDIDIDKYDQWNIRITVVKPKNKTSPSQHPFCGWYVYYDRFIGFSTLCRIIQFVVMSLYGVIWIDRYPLVN